MKIKNDHKHVEVDEVTIEKAHEDDDDILWVTSFEEEKTKEFVDKLFKISAKDPKKPIIIYIDSYGGYVDCLAAMIAALDAVPNKIITVAMGKAMSCGAMLLSHGDVRYASKHARIMVHEVSAMAWGNINDLKNNANESTRLNEHWMGWLAENCGMKLKDMLKKFTNKRRDIYMTPEEAIAFGLVEKVGVPKLKKVVRYEIDG